MAHVASWLNRLLLLMHDRNLFAKYMGMEIVDIQDGESVVTMFVTHKHTNNRGVIHGGALVSLADMAMGLACHSLARRVVTLDLNISFTRRVKEGDTVKALSKVVHNGKTTMVVEGHIVDSTERLLATARGTFFVIGQYNPDLLSRACGGHKCRPSIATSRASSFSRVRARLLFLYPPRKKELISSKQAMPTKQQGHRNTPQQCFCNILISQYFSICL